jgi:hypothetical protein
VRKGMKNKKPKTAENLKRHFIVNAAINSSVALQMAQQVFTDGMDGYEQVFDYVDMINSISLKLAKRCDYLNWEAHSQILEEKK